MSSISETRAIKAPIENVFDTIAHIENFKQVVPDIVQVEYTSEQKRGVGTRFKETRRMGKRDATVELEVTEYVSNDHVRLISDAGGTIWDTVFTVKPAKDETTELAMVMQVKPYKLIAKLFTPLILRLVRRGVSKDMDAVKEHCEAAHKARE